MDFKTILVKNTDGIMTITLNRPHKQNSINAELLKEINRALDISEQDTQCKMIVIAGQNGTFCTGMDFDEVSQKQECKAAMEDLKSSQDPEFQSHASPYMDTLKRFSLIPKVVVTLVDGRAMAGGVGLVAASDLVIATPRSEFSLSEALWGLLPSMVTPFLIRRIGFQLAYRMTLTTIPVSAGEAYDFHLVDELSESPQDVLKRYWLRIIKLESSTIANLKQYFRKMWIISDQMEETAVAETNRLSNDPRVVGNIVNYVRYQKFPWDN